MHRFKPNLLCRWWPSMPTAQGQPLPSLLNSNWASATTCPRCPKASLSPRRLMAGGWWWAFRRRRATAAARSPGALLAGMAGGLPGKDTLTNCCHGCCSLRCSYTVAVHRADTADAETTLTSTVEHAADTLIPAGGRYTVTLTGVPKGFYQASMAARRKHGVGCNGLVCSSPTPTPHSTSCHSAHCVQVTVAATNSVGAGPATAKAPGTPVEVKGVLRLARCSHTLNWRPAQGRLHAMPLSREAPKARSHLAAPSWNTMPLPPSLQIQQRRLSNCKIRSYSALPAAPLAVPLCGSCALQMRVGSRVRWASGIRSSPGQHSSCSHPCRQHQPPVAVLPAQPWWRHDWQAQCHSRRPH